jgi:hypothetical protein
MAKKKSNNALFDKLDAIKQNETVNEASSTQEMAVVETDSNTTVVDAGTFIGKLHSLSNSDKEKLEQYDKLLDENVKLYEEKSNLIDSINTYIEEINELRLLISKQDTLISTYLAEIKSLKNNENKVKTENANNVSYINKKQINNNHPNSIYAGYTEWN